METNQRIVRLHRAQKAFRHSEALFCGFVGGRGSGKSFAGAYKMLRRAKKGRTYMVASPTGVLMQDTTFPTFMAQARDLNMIRSVKTSPYPNVELRTGATVRFRTAENPERLRGPNLSGVWLDEASLMHPEAFKICIACLRESGEQGFLDATFTPKGLSHWTYDVFGKRRPDTEIFHATTWDNPFNPPEFADTLARQYTSGESQQELRGEFIDADEAFQVIPTAWVRAAMDRWKADGHNGKPMSALGCDIARGGSAKTVLAPRHGLWWDKLLKFPGKSTPDGPSVAGLIAVNIRANPQVLVIVDVIGVGSSVFDDCHRRGLRVYGCNFGAATNATDRTGLIRFVNIRAFAYWSMRELLDPANGHNAALPPDDELIADLTSARWSSTASGVKIEPKEKIEERLGRSVDCGDALVYSILSPM